MVYCIQYHERLSLILYQHSLENYENDEIGGSVFEQQSFFYVKYIYKPKIKVIYKYMEEEQSKPRINFRGYLVAFAALLAVAGGLYLYANARYNQVALTPPVVAKVQVTGTVSCDSRAKTCKVTPSGDTSGVTDQDNLNTAFAAASAFSSSGQSPTVRLSSGTFYIHKSLLVSNFSGHLVGAGRAMDVGTSGTTITNAPGVTFGLPDWSFTGYEDKIPTYPTFVTFYMDNAWDADDAADIEVSDLTAHWSGVTEDWALEFDFLKRDQLGAYFWVAGRLTGTNDPTEISLVSSKFHNLELTAEPNPIPTSDRYGNTSRPSDAIAIFNLVTELQPDANGDGIQANAWLDTKPIVGRQEINDVHIENNRFPIFITGLDDSNVVINNLTVDNLTPAAAAVVFCDNSNSNFTVTGVETTNATGIVAVAGHWRTTPILLSHYDISQNTISLNGGNGIILNDAVNRRTGVPAIAASITQNTISGSSGTAHILNSRADNAVISQNVLSGTGGSAGIFSIGQSNGNGGNGNVLHKNQFGDDFTSSLDIFLLRNRGDIVFGDDLTDTVLDVAGSGNTIINANGTSKSALDPELERELQKALKDFSDSQRMIKLKL